jgi:phage/plasmid-associated DNA primase
MLDQLVAASTLTAAEKEHAARGFQHAKRGSQTLDPLMKLRGYAEGLLGTREQELMAVREAITAHTDPALEANAPLAADALLTVLDYCERRDSNNRVHSLGNIAHMGLFLYYIWRRIARYGFDSSQQSDSTQWTFYLFNGATYERGQWDQFAIEAEEHLRLVVEELLSRPQLSSRTMTLDARCNSSDFVAKGLAKMQMLIKHVKRLAKCGLISPTEFERTLDTGNFIGLTNGVFDVTGDRFMPTGSVPLNVLVSVTTRFSYVGEDDPAFPENRAQLVELYRTLHADDYTNPNDERLRAMWIFAGSLLTRGNVNKKAFIFLGSEGDNGKSTYTELLQATLGDYAVTGNKRALSGNEQDSLDPDLVSNHKALMCVFPEMQSMEGGVSTGFRFNYGKLKSLTGTDPLAVRALFKNKKDIVFYAKLVAHTNIAPHVDGDDSASCNRLWMARFGSTFPEGLTEADVHRRRFPRIDDIKERIVQWAPYHFLMCLEALREFRKLKFVLPPGAQHIEGSLMHQSAAAQTPEGKLRGWVEQNYTHIANKDNGTKLKDLYEAYSTAVPSVHQRPLQKRRFGEMMCSLFPGIGPHTNRAGTIQGLFLLARYGE